MLTPPPNAAYMTNETIRFFPHDRFMAATILRLIPSQIYPNHITILRGVLTPVVWYFLFIEQWSVLVPLFLLTAFTDVIDGSLARNRKQITLWGTIADPIVDKFLIGSVMIIFVAQEINIAFAIVILAAEALIALSGYRRIRRGEVVSANLYGKVKMFLQVLGVTVLLIAKLSGLNLFVPVSEGTFALAIAFAIMSLVTYGF